MMEDQEEVTATSFRVVVSETEPYSFQECAAQQVHSSVRITHITFTPPSADEVRAYELHHQKTGATDIRPATLARLRSLSAAGVPESFVVACFPWHAADDSPSSAAAAAAESPTVAAAEKRKKKEKGKGKGKEKGKYEVEEEEKGEEEEEEEEEAAVASGRVRLAGLFEVALPRPTDICHNVDLRLDVDGSVWLEVAGPGSVTLFGEQYSALIPEWLSHHFFSVGEDDEEGDEDEDNDEGDFAEMYRLIH